MSISYVEKARKPVKVSELGAADTRIVAILVSILGGE
jgi:hypothetical protein